MFKLVGEVILDLLSPRFCCGCGKLDTYLCPDCFNTIDYISLPLTHTLGKNYLESLQAACYYDGVIKELLQTCKYDSVYGVGECLGEFLYYATLLPQVDLITAVPLHQQRERERGFNQSVLIAQKLSALTEIPFCDMLTRTTYTAPQANISDAAKRQSNVAHCFAISAAASDCIQNKRILIIDDVTTTGATMNACARVLCEAGAQLVQGLVVAHGSS
jgi:ComF family protein